MSLYRLPLLCAFALACQPGEPPDDAPPGPTARCMGSYDAPTKPDATAAENPIAPGVAMLPYPSDQYLVADASMVSGWRVEVGEAILPEGLTPAMFARDDGFSRVAPILTWMPGSFDPSTLPDANDWGATLSPDASVILVAEQGCDLAPVMAEIDLTASASDLATLILRPHGPLRPNTRYAVILRSTLRARDGSEHSPSSATRALLAGDAPSSDAIASQAPGFALVLDAAAHHNIPTDTILQAFTFRTRSAVNATADAIHLQDEAATVTLGAHTLEDPEEHDDHVRIYGSLTVPSFLTTDKRLRRDDSGLPRAEGTMQAPFLITVPRTVTEPRPTILFGHGFFSSIDEPTWGNLRDGLTRWQMPAVSTEFIGFSSATEISSLGILGSRLHDLDTVIDQQLQSQSHFTQVHRLITERLAATLEVDLGDGSIKPLSATNVPYLGISNGGTQGLVLMATSPVLERGAVVVPGGGWSHMLQRATQWNDMGALFASRYPDPRELQVTMALVQQVFDRVDSLNYAEHLINDRLPGRPEAPELLMVEALHDTQVANLVTRWVALAAGFTQIVPAIDAVWGLDTEEAPAPDGASTTAGYVQHDLGAEPPPEGNMPPATDNGVHGDVRRTDAYREQMGVFLEFGRITQPCDGPCDPD